MSIAWVYLFKPFNYTMWNYSSLLHRFCMGVFIHTFQLYHLQQFTACHLYACIYLNLSIIFLELQQFSACLWHGCIYANLSITPCGLTAVYMGVFMQTFQLYHVDLQQFTACHLHGCIYSNISIIPCGLAAVYKMGRHFLYMSRDM